MIKILSRYNQGQLSIKLPKKEYRILASQDKNIIILITIFFRKCCLTGFF